MPQPFPTATRRSKTLIALLSVTLAALGTTSGGQAQSADEALPLATSFTVTGNYVVGGVDLAPGGSSGFVTGTIPMSGVPANADILAAFLYWETITSDDSQLAGARFRGQPMTVVRTAQTPLEATYAPCWSSGGGGTYKMTMHRADVRRLLPVQLDANGAPTGRRLVNSADLAAAGFAPHTVTLPEAGTGNQVPQSAGASLFVVYRDPLQPLTKIVLYDGLHVGAPGAAMTHAIRGFLQSRVSPSAKLTHIVGSGAKNTSERIRFHAGKPSDGLAAATILDADPFQAGASSSDRSWSNPTYNVSSLMPASLSGRTNDYGDGYGETVGTSVDHTKSTPYECLAWAAIAFSTTVQDRDNDGLIDKLEDTSGLRDPNGSALPDIHAMGAGSDQRDLFLEVGAMQAAAGTSYGSSAAPFAARIDDDPANDVVTDAIGHNHMPTPRVLKLVGDTLARAPADAASGVPGIRLHVDAGPAYHALGPAYAAEDADAYLVPPAHARGGELMSESACDPAAVPSRPCLFPDYPGTVSWKVGFQMYRDARVDDAGQELSAQELAACRTAGGCERRRFDPARQDVFHYALYAHAGGIPRSQLACLDSTGSPVAAVAPPGSPAACGSLAPNPAFHVPTSASGRGDLPGGDFIVTLGLWDKEAFVGTDFVQASTTLHELGHNLERWHGGDPPTIGTVRGTVTTRRGTTFTNVQLAKVTFEPNCKPNYQSLMSYMFQINGLIDDDGVRHLDYSGSVVGPAVDETNVQDGSLPTPLAYRASWYAPLLPGTLGWTLGTKKATRYCNGLLFSDPLPTGWTDVARIDAASRSESIDWNAGGTPQLTSQDVNFDSRLNGAFTSPATAPLRGADDWANLHLNQIGSRRNIAGFSIGHLGGYVDGGYVDGGYVDGGYVDGGYVDGGYVDGGYVDGGYVDGGYVDGGYVDGGYVDGGYVDGGYVDGGYVDGGYVDGGYVDGGYVDGGHVDGSAEITFEIAGGMGYAPPAELRACVIDGVTCLSPVAAPNTNRVRLDWKLPHAGSPLRYFVYRTQGATVVAGATLVAVEPMAGVPGVAGQVNYAIVDPQELPDGVQFTYLVKAQFPDGPDDDDEPDLSIPSNYATITAKSQPPQVTLTLGGLPTASGWFTSAPVPVTITASDDFSVASIACSDNGNPIVVTATGLGTNSASLSLGVIGDGTHVLSCAATDAAGNAATASGTIRIDTVPPVATIVSGPTGALSSFTFTGSDATSGIASFECQWDGGAFSPCVSPAAASGAAVGSHTFAVRAIDVAGNVGPAVSRAFSQSYTVTPAPITIKSSAQLGSAVPVDFQVRNPDGTLVQTTSVVQRIESVYQGARCPVGSTAGTAELLYRNPDLSTGNSSLRYQAGNQSLQFNWDTTSAATLPTITGKGCYIVLIYLNDGGAPARTTPITLK